MSYKVAIVRKPHNRKQFIMTRASLVIERMTITPAFPLGFSFVGASGRAEVINHSQEIISQGDDKSLVTIPVYTVKTGDGRQVTCRTHHIIHQLGNLPMPPRETIALVSIDGLDHLIQPGYQSEQLVEPKLRRFYLDSYGWGVQKIIIGGICRLIDWIEHIHPSDIHENTSCARCGARRTLRGPDTVTGDVASLMYSTGTWDKTGPVKNNIHCAWLGEPNLHWEWACIVKNESFRRYDKMPQITLADIGKECPRFYNIEEGLLPRPAAYPIHQDTESGCIFVETPGWDIELYV